MHGALRAPAHTERLASIYHLTSKRPLPWPLAPIHVGRRGAPAVGTRTLAAGTPHLAPASTPHLPARALATAHRLGWVWMAHTRTTQPPRGSHVPRMKHVHKPRRVGHTRVSFGQRRQRRRVVDPVQHVAPREQLRHRQLWDDRPNNLDLPDLLSPAHKRLKQLIRHRCRSMHEVIVGRHPLGGRRRLRRRPNNISFRRSHEETNVALEASVANAFRSGSS